MGENTQEKVCEICEGTGKVSTTWTNPDTHLPEPDGEEPCVCQLVEHDETPEE